jgi:RND family efflux transporter MFP subunit
MYCMNRVAMNTHSTFRGHGGISVRHRARTWLAWLTGAMTFLSVSLGRGGEFDGFTEPYRKVNVASVETGTIKSIEVREGASVEKGQVVARLDDDLYLALLAIADESMRAQSTLNAAQVELEMRRERWEKLNALRVQGHARQEEVDRAYADVEIAEARVLSAKELMEVKRLEHEKAKVQLARRAITAPLAGIVSVVRKDEGEFVAPNDPYVLEIVALDPLLATFSVPSPDAARLRHDDTVTVYVDGADQLVKGQVETISPVTDAESGTTRIKVRIANPAGQYRSGERCTLKLENVSSTVRPGP